MTGSAELTSAIEELRSHQTQLDMDGVMVGVSRQALEEVLTILSLCDMAEASLRSQGAGSTNDLEHDSAPLGELTKHTPGPWHVMPDGFSCKGVWSAPVVYATDDELRYVAVCACADDLNFGRATDNLANARFIAAAPDMLAALKTARQYVGANAGRDAIDAAIAKAEGGAA